MRRGTTPTVTLTVTNEDGSDCDLTNHEIYITFKEQRPNGSTFTKRETDDGVTVSHVDSSSVISIFLTQRETLSFKEESIVRVQVRCKALGIATATDIETFAAEEILLEGEI